MASYDPFYNYPALYDLAYRWRTDEECAQVEASFRRYAQGPIRTVLDLACGTGRHLIRLAQRGYRLIGLDASEPMLQFARGKLEGFGLSADLVHQPLEHFQIAEPVDVAICLMDSIRALTTDAMWQTHLASVERCLHPGGLYLIDCWVASACDPAQAISERWEQEEDGLRVAVQYHQFAETLDPQTRTIEDQLSFIVSADHTPVNTVISGRRMRSRFLIDSELVTWFTRRAWSLVADFTDWSHPVPPDRYPARRLFVFKK